MAQARRAPVPEQGAALGQIAAEARDEALYLILRTLGLPLDSGPSVLGRRLSAAESPRRPGPQEAARRARPGGLHHPRGLARGPALHVDERVLIPRSYFVEILPAQVDPWLGTPGGDPRRRRLHGLGLPCDPARPALQEGPGGRDRPFGDALEVARSTSRRHRLGAASGLLQGRPAQPCARGRYDVILSNPPYEPSAHVDALPPEFRGSPAWRSTAAPDGLDLIRRLVRQARGA
jgi:ribosomal protein L3 glutamine methyltransferase